MKVRIAKIITTNQMNQNDSGIHCQKCEREGHFLPGRLCLLALLCIALVPGCDSDTGNNKGQVSESSEATHSAINSASEVSKVGDNEPTNNTFESDEERAELERMNIGLLFTLRIGTGITLGDIPNNPQSFEPALEAVRKMKTSSAKPMAFVDMARTMDSCEMKESAKQTIKEAIGAIKNLKNENIRAAAASEVAANILELGFYEETKTLLVFVKDPLSKEYFQKKIEESRSR